jgi:hypothetical protein
MLTDLKYQLFAVILNILFLGFESTRTQRSAFLMREFIYKEIIAKDKALIVLAFQRAGLVPVNPSIYLIRLNLVKNHLP